MDTPNPTPIPKGKVFDFVKKIKDHVKVKTTPNDDVIVDDDELRNTQQDTNFTSIQHLHTHAIAELREDILKLQQDLATLVSILPQTNRL